MDLFGYFLSDDPDEPFKWSFPPKTYLPPRAYHLVWADGIISSLYGSHTNFKLDVSGETILLHNRRRRHSAIGDQTIEELERNNHIFKNAAWLNLLS